MSTHMRSLAVLNEEQRVESLQYIPRITSALSLVGSGLIVVAILAQKGALSKDVYKRIMFSLSLYDLLGAIWTVLGSVPVPEEYGLPGSRGNMAVCNAQGFFIHFAVIATNIYNAALMVYFVLKIRYNVAGKVLAKRFEPTVHCSAFVVSLALALSGVLTEVFNPIGFGGPSNSPLCWIQAFPPGCDFVPDMECVRGANASVVMWYIAIVPLITALVILLGSLTLVVYTVMERVNANRRYAFQNSIRGSNANTTWSLSIKKNTNDPNGNDPNGNDPNGNNPNGNDPNGNGDEAGDNFVDNEVANGNSNDNGNTKSRIVRKKKKKASSLDKKVTAVTKRCILYGLVFFNTFVWTSVSMIIHNKEPPEWDSFWIGCLAFLFMPLQGFFNFLIYIHPQYATIRRSNPDKNVFWVVYNSIFRSSSNGTSRSSRGTSRSSSQPTSRRLTL